MAKVKRICEQCGKAFEFYDCPSTAKHGRGRYCSSKCKNEANTTKVKRVCEMCGKEFYVPLSYIAKGRGRYCSLKCFGKHNKNRIECKCISCGKIFYACPCTIKAGKSKYCSIDCVNNKFERKVKVICKQCGKIFYVFPSKIKKGEGIYCSSECYNLSRQEPANCICKQCGIQFYAMPSKIKDGKGVFCSKQCAGKYWSIHRCGENAPGWKGGLSFEPYCMLFNSDFKERVRLFFDNKCALCGKEQDTALSVHHVNYDKKTCCNDSDRLFVPLCTSCHSKTNFNRDYWQEYFTKMIHEEYGGKCYFTKEEYNVIKTA